MREKFSYQEKNNVRYTKNYPGYANISGPDLAEKCLSLLENLGVEIIWSGRAHRGRPRATKKITDDKLAKTQR